MNVPFYTATREYKNLKAEFDTALSSVLEMGDFILGKAVARHKTVYRCKICGRRC